MLQLLGICIFLLIGLNEGWKECREDEFPCSVSFRCIPKHYVCDGWNDCWDKSDETGCPIAICGYEEFTCKSQDCIPKWYVCDKEADCPDGSDEQNCSDEENDQAICRSQMGDFYLLVANGQVIKQVDTENGECNSLVNSWNSKTSIDYIYEDDLLVWIDTSEKAIKSTVLSKGKPVKTLVRGNMSWPEKIATDWVNKDVYWTDSRKWTLEKLNLETKERKILVQKAGEAFSVAVDPYNRWVYWSTIGIKAQIERINFDGTNREIIISDNIFMPLGITLDLRENKLYWTDAKIRGIFSADFDGNNRKVVFRSSEYLVQPFAIDVFESYIYWSDWKSDWKTATVYRAEKSEFRQIETILTDIFFAVDVTVVHHTSKQRK